MDILIKHGFIYDGSGEEPYLGDIYVKNGRIERIVPEQKEMQGETTSLISSEESDDLEIVDADGFVVTPGFIDIHRHCDIKPFSDSQFGEIELMQGITTTFVGNCGLAPVPSVQMWQNELYDFLEPVIGTMPKGLFFEEYEDYFHALELTTLPIHMGVLAGSDSIKVAVKGFGSEPYSSEELTQAQEYVRKALDLGAFGLTLGIMYQPECYSSREELTEVVKAAAGRDVVLCTHIRGEGDSLLESVKEVIDIAGNAGVPLNISHFKATGIKNWNAKIYEAIALIDQARENGQDVTADFYPYDGGATTLLSLLPPSVTEGSMEELMHKLSGIEGKRFLQQELCHEHQGWDNMAESIGWDRILISSVTLKQHESMMGKTIAQLVEELTISPTDLIAKLIVEEQGKVGIIVLSMSQDDQDAVAKLPYTILISDALYGGDPRFAHPRLFGSTARFLKNYVRERKILTMSQAIQKMTLMPAQRMGLTDRGLVKEGYYADLLMFDPNQFCDHADYFGNRAVCSGLEAVWLEGEQVLEHGYVQSLTNGRLLRKRN